MISRLVIYFLILFSVAGVMRAQNVVLDYAEPAVEWADALPIGNGRMGAMIYGGIDEERVQIAEESLWSGGPHNYDNPEAYNHLSDVRSLLRNEKFSDAEALAEKMMGKPVYQAAFQPLGDLVLKVKNQGALSDYRRLLDLQKGEVSVSYKSGGVSYKRTMFASYPDDAIVVQFDCSEMGMLTFDLLFESLHPVEHRAEGAAGMIFEGQVASRLKPMGDGSRKLISLWKKPGTKFAAQIEVRSKGGEVSYENDKISVKHADSVTVLFSAATSFVNYADVSGDPLKKLKACFAGLKDKGYEELRKRHRDDHGSLFDRVSLTLNTELKKVSTTELMDKVKKGNVDASLAELVFQYGRYLMIAGSRPGSQPLTLQGKWNSELSPRWGSKYTININTEMNYWLAEVGNLSECHEPLFDMLKDLQMTGQKTAKTHYKAKGWVTHHNTDLWRGTAPVDGAHWGMWPMGGAWLSQHMWERYLYTLDKDFLKSSYPLLKGAVEFYLDTLIKDKNGKLLTSPSLSPEHSHGGGMDGGMSNDRSGVSLCEGPTMDLLILRDLFSNYIKSAEILELDDELRAKVALASSQLAPLKIGRHGQLQEWQTDWDNPDVPHSHVSHLYGLFPSAQINPQDTPVLSEATKTSLIHRGYSRGWSGAWRAALWARLGNDENALTALQHTIADFGTNLFNYGMNFQIDANFGVAAAIAEMLMQSHLTDDEGVVKIVLLPALPDDWSSGSISGLKARGGFTIDFTWEEGLVTSYQISTDQVGECLLIFNDTEQKLKLDKGMSSIWESSTKAE